MGKKIELIITRCGNEWVGVEGSEKEWKGDNEWNGVGMNGIHL